MMDQQNFEAERPVSADPHPAVTPGHPASVESLAKELGLKLGDQNQLTIRRIKRGKSYSFVRANGTAIRHTGTIKRLHSMAGCNTAIIPTGRRFASTARRIGWRGWSLPCRKSAVTSRCI